jgi:hypothetical protein
VHRNSRDLFQADSRPGKIVFPNELLFDIYADFSFPSTLLSRTVIRVS